MPVERLHDTTRVIPHDLEDVDEFRVRVREHRLFRLEVEENGPSAKERLEVSLALVREERVELGEELGLPARPLQERVGLGDDRTEGAELASHRTLRAQPSTPAGCGNGRGGFYCTGRSSEHAVVHFAVVSRVILYPFHSS